MNIQKFTQKSVEAINDCEKLAYEYGNQEIEQEHLMVALRKWRSRNSILQIMQDENWKPELKCPEDRFMWDRI